MSGGFAFDPDTFVAPTSRPASNGSRRSSQPRSDWTPPPLTVPGIRPHDNNGLPRDWKQGLDQLNTMDPPTGASPDRWAQLVLDAHRLAWGWQEEATAAGWSIVDLFGIDPVQPSAEESLSIAIRGGRVVGLGLDERERRFATILTAGGNHHCHYARMPAGARALWSYRGDRR